MGNNRTCVCVGFLWAASLFVLSYMYNNYPVDAAEHTWQIPPAAEKQGIPLTTSEPSYQPQSTLTTSFPTAVLMRLDAIETRLDTIAKFQKDIVAPMHKEMLEKLKELHQ